MNLVVPVEFTTPDGVTRRIRATNGARRRIANHFGEPNVQKILADQGDGALSAIAYMMMYDEDGNPPDISLGRFSESLSWGDGMPLLALVLSAFSQGQTSPNEMEAQLAAVQALGQDTTTDTGSTFGDSAGSASGLQIVSSGTDTSNVKLTPSGEPTASKSEAEPS